MASRSRGGRPRRRGRRPRRARVRRRAARSPVANASSACPPSPTASEKGVPSCELADPHRRAEGGAGSGHRGPQLARAGRARERNDHATTASPEALIPACTDGSVELPVAAVEELLRRAEGRAGRSAGRRGSRSRPGFSATAISPSPASETATASEFPLACSGAGSASVTGPQAPPGSRTAACTTCSASLPAPRAARRRRRARAARARRGPRAVDGVRHQLGDLRQPGRAGAQDRRAAVDAPHELARAPRSRAGSPRSRSAGCERQLAERCRGGARRRREQEDERDEQTHAGQIPTAQPQQTGHVG